MNREIRNGKKMKRTIINKQKLDPPPGDGDGDGDDGNIHLNPPPCPHAQGWNIPFGMKPHFDQWG